MNDQRPASDKDVQAGLPIWKWGPDLCAAFVEQLPVAGASICVIGVGGIQSAVCTSDAISAHLDQLEFDLGEGPRTEVSRTDQPVLCADVRSDSHREWPVFGAAAVALGVGALFAFPIMMGAVRLGVVGLYRDTAGGLTQKDLRHARFLARMVATKMVDAAVQTAGQSDALDARRPPGMRREVHQATGMILMQLNITATDAFAALRANAFASGRTVDDVAHDVLTGAIDFRP